jgi:hypothetical protein
MKGLRIDRDNELIAYAAKKITIAIFHLGGVLHYSEPVPGTTRWPLGNNFRTIASITGWFGFS